MRAPLSVVVPTRDRVGLLERCLAALRAELTESDEILVVDSASGDAAAVAAAAHEAGATLVRCDRAGASLARNAGWRAARNDLVAFVDDDVRVLPNWSTGLVNAFDDPDVVFVTGRVVVPADQQAAERPVAITSRTEREVLHAGLSGDLGASANLAVRRAALAAVGGFDETLGPGSWAAAAEDLDLFDRLFRAGYTGSFEPHAAAEHDQWRTRPQLIRLDWRYGKGMGVRLARLARWDRPRARRLFREAVIEQGVRPVLDDLRHGYEFGALTVATRTLATVLGVAVGSVRAWTSVRARGLTK
ncbi:MAG TPA: glycosyltransferase [Mycobacteriales bacterium]|jgi:glycosyltransferase involved in cell wall biosynthesis|nr:glycosyltransferase [Mycobacteriales bacterium]HVX69818.1 glycosyltransferase [Mycobacteriales bacterium]